MYVLPALPAADEKNESRLESCEKFGSNACMRPHKSQRCRKHVNLSFLQFRGGRQGVGGNGRQLSHISGKTITFGNDTVLQDHQLLKWFKYSHDIYLVVFYDI